MYILRNYKLPFYKILVTFLSFLVAREFIFLSSNELVGRRTFIYLIECVENCKKPTDKKRLQECSLISRALVQLERPFLKQLEKLNCGLDITY